MTASLEKAQAIAEAHGIEIDVNKEEPFFGEWYGYIDAPKGKMFQGTSTYVTCFHGPIKSLPKLVTELVGELTDEDATCREERQHSQGD